MYVFILLVRHVKRITSIRSWPCDVVPHVRVQSLECATLTEAGGNARRRL